MPRSTALLLTCEHGGNRVPAAYAPLFRGRHRLLDSHRGYDPGALPLARVLARQLDAPLHFSTVSRLLVELNRSIGHPALFSGMVKRTPRDTRARILDRYYFPYRRGVESHVARLLDQGQHVLHLSVHTFTPVLNGVTRTTGIGLLYDPQRRGERNFCAAWRDAIVAAAPEYTVHRNAPYRGSADGFTSSLRRRFPASRYWGIELEVNQRLAAGETTERRGVQRIIAETLREALRAK